MLSLCTYIRTYVTLCTYSAHYSSFCYIFGNFQLSFIESVLLEWAFWICGLCTYIRMSIPTYVRTYMCVLFWTLVDYYMQNLQACVCVRMLGIMYIYNYIDWCIFLLQPHAFVIKKVIKPDVCQVVSARLDPGLECLDRFGQNPSPVFSLTQSLQCKKTIMFGKSAHRCKCAWVPYTYVA